ncbi:hypothetical protein GGS21DRAFT_494102 [Xylaria nigripes]|nr:hypothetical protein GGS21DRAFT_494102 [Xylaria nigripes]
MADGIQMPSSFNLDTLSPVDWVLYNNLKRLSENAAQSNARVRLLEEYIIRLSVKVDELQANQAARQASDYGSSRPFDTAPDTNRFGRPAPQMDFRSGFFGPKCGTPQALASTWCRPGEPTVPTPAPRTSSYQPQPQAATKCPGLQSIGAPQSKDPDTLPKGWGVGLFQCSQRTQTQTKRKAEQPQPQPQPPSQSQLTDKAKNAGTQGEDRHPIATTQGKDIKKSDAENKTCPSTANRKPSTGSGPCQPPQPWKVEKQRPRATPPRTAWFNIGKKVTPEEPYRGISSNGYTPSQGTRQSSWVSFAESRFDESERE